MNSAYANYQETGHPDQTIAHRAYKGVLDYIFYSGKCRPVKLRKVPGQEELQGYTPNAERPSDHLPITAYFCYHEKVI